MQYTISTFQRGIIFCFFLMVAGPATQFAWGYADRDRGRDRDNGEISRREQMIQEAQQTASEVKDMLDRILEVVSVNQTPDQQLIADAAALLEDNKRNMLAYEDEQKATYMLLRAWTDFYQGSSENAMTWALRACKTDMTNGDAWISQSLFCMLNGKRPPEPRIRPEPRQEPDNGRRARPRPRRQNQPEDNDRYASASQPYGRKGALSFDLAALHPEMLKERFSRLQYQTFSGSQLEYVPGQDTLCAFFWQIEPSIVDSNDISVDARNARLPENRLMMEANRGYGINMTNSLDPVRQGVYFRSLYDLVKDHADIICVAMNTNAVQDADKVATEMDEDFAREIMKIPIVFASARQSGAANFVGVDAMVPFMLIADKQGIVRYAGPAADFMPAFILTHLTGADIPVSTSGNIEMPTAGQPEAAAAPAQRSERFEPDTMRGPRERAVRPPARRAPNRTVAEPNQPADPNAVRPVVQKPPPGTPAKVVKPVEITLEEQVKADKLLSLAQMEIEACRKIRGKSPAQGVEACKKILEAYPGSDYAEKAREQLKRVPERYWDRFGIADLLGY